MPTLNYTTKVPVSRTVGEVQAMLAAHGANAVAVRYDDGSPVGVSFVLPTPHGERAFTLPVDVPAVLRLLAEQARTGALRSAAPRGGWATPEHAARVAWRVVKDWLEAQLAVIDAQMATLDQVMLPYLHVDGEVTLYQRYLEREQAALTAGSSGGG